MNVYAVSDLHGQIDLYKQIKTFLKKNDIIYCLGDCGDRGPANWELIKAVARDPQFILLKGNHEDMLVKAMCEYGRDEYMGKNCHLLFSNGGESTLFGWITDGADMGWMNYLSKLPTIKSYYNQYQDIEIVMCHAGYSNYDDTIPCEEDLLWSREHFLDIPPKGRTLMVHGHTPIPYLAEDLGIKEAEFEGAFWYCNDKKVCIDCGAFATGMTVLLDLDTFDEHIFQI